MNNLTHAYAQMECMPLDEAHTMLNELAWDCYDPVEFLNDCGLPLIHLLDAVKYAQGAYKEQFNLEPKVVGDYEGRPFNKLETGKQKVILYLDVYEYDNMGFKIETKTNNRAC